MNDYIIWIGSVYDEKYLKHNPASSPAANYWQINLLRGLNHHNHKILLLSYNFQRIFPFGDILPNGSRFWKDGFNILNIIYLNLPFLKTLTIIQVAKFKLRKFFRKAGTPKFVISYNPTVENCKISYYLKKKYSVKWIDLCADSYDPGIHWEQYNSLAKLADGHVFLSYYAFSNCPFDNLFHFDGGIDIGKVRYHNIKDLDTKVLLYSGMLGEYGGVDLLIESFSKIFNHNLRLVICGHGKPSSFFENAVKNDSRINFHGQVTETELEKLYEEADIFINPRPLNLNGSDMNFPSKIHKYMSYGKPIISTKTLGLSKEYDSFLFYFDFAIANSLEKLIFEIAGWDVSKRIKYAKRVDLYIRHNKNWVIQSEHLSNWLNFNYNDAKY